MSLYQWTLIGTGRKLHFAASVNGWWAESVCGMEGSVALIVRDNLLPKIGRSKCKVCERMTVTPYECEKQPTKVNVK